MHRTNYSATASVLIVLWTSGCRIDETPQPVTAGGASLRARAATQERIPAAKEQVASDENSLSKKEASVSVAKKEVLYIQQLGKEETPDFAEDMAFVQKAVESFYALDVKMLPPIDLPKEAWYAPRRRYRAERLLDYLERMKPSDSRILGITTKDISTTKGRIDDWGILGLATIDGTVGVVSRFRAARKTGGGASEALTVRYRFAKTVVHELGHNFGLNHCPHKGCIMEDAKGTVKTTDGEYTLCPACRETLARLFPAIAVDNIQPPWPEP